MTISGIAGNEATRVDNRCEFSVLKRKIMKIAVESKQQAVKEAAVREQLKTAGFWQCFVSYTLHFYGNFLFIPHSIHHRFLELVSRREEFLRRNGNTVSANEVFHRSSSNAFFFFVPGSSIVGHVERSDLRTCRIFGILHGRSVSGGAGRNRPLQWRILRFRAMFNGPISGFYGR